MEKLVFSVTLWKQGAGEGWESTRHDRHSCVSHRPVRLIKKRKVVCVQACSPQNSSRYVSLRSRCDSVVQAPIGGVFQSSAVRKFQVKCISVTWASEDASLPLVHIGDEVVVISWGRPAFTLALSPRCRGGRLGSLLAYVSWTHSRLELQPTRRHGCRFQRVSSKFFKQLF